MEIVLDVHSELLAIVGGADGVRDMGLLESAMAGARNKFVQGDDDLASLAAAYAFGIARNHPFVDGNKQAAFAATLVFLGLNGGEFLVPEAQATAMMLSLAAGEVDEELLARWIRDNWPR